MSNVSELIELINRTPIGESFDVATSQYANNTAVVPFQHWSTASAVRACVKRGLIEADYGWRYYECKVIKHTEDN